MSETMKKEEKGLNCKEVQECIICLHGVVGDVLPQIGGIVLQDYERLNRGMILAERMRRKGCSIQNAQ